MSKDHTIEKFQRVVFDAENTDLPNDAKIKFPLGELAAVARKLYAYEKFIAELQDSLKEGNEKRRMITEKIEEL